MEKHQKICVGAFIYKDGKILITRRSKNEGLLPGYWDVPGGKVNFGETPEEALKRETREEANLKIEPIIPCFAFSYVSMEGMRHNVDIQYIVKLTGDINELELDPSHDEYKWIGLEEIDSLPEMSDNMKEALKKGFETIKNLNL